MCDFAAPEQWQFIAFDESFIDMPQQQWLLGIAGNRPVVCELNYIAEHRVAVRSGTGVAGLPCFIAEADSDLVRVDRNAPPFSRDIWLAVHSDLRNSRPVRAVMEFVAGVVEENPLLRP